MSSSSVYQSQPVYQLLGSKVSVSTVPENSDPSFVVTPKTLTASYAGNISPAVPNSGMQQVIFNIQYTAGLNVTSLSMKIEGSADEAKYSAPVNWFQETADSVGTGTTTMYLQERSFTNNGGAIVQGTTYSFEIKVPIARRFLRISLKENLSSGTTFGSVYVEATTSGK